MKYFSKNPKITITLVSLLLFLAVLPLSLKINYIQNDEWAFFPIIQNFLSGNFKLTPLCAPTFYSIGILATIFSAFFGISKLPTLTMFISVLNFAVFSLIIYEFYGKSLPKSFLISALLFFNPLHVYSALGFMTENYLIAPMLVSLYFYLNYRKNGVAKNLILFMAFSFVAFMTKQAAITLPLSVLIFSLLSNKRKDAFKLGVFLTIMVCFYIFIFPRTPAMSQKSLLFTHFLKTNYVYTLIYGVFLMLSAFSLPLIPSAITTFIKKFNVKQVLGAVLLSILLFLSLNKFFVPSTISWGEFPYFENTFERSGLFPRNINGTKYLFKYNYDLYKYWDLSAKILLAIFLSTGILYLSQKFLRNEKPSLTNIKTLYVIFIAVYLGLMIVAETFYDRYYFLLIIPFVLLLINEKKLGSISIFFTTIFVIFLMFFSYQFSMDFVLLNNAVWTKTNQLMEQKNIKANEIKSTKIWSRYYPVNPNVAADYKYIFSFDETPSKVITTKEPIQSETIDINFPLSIWTNPKIYLLEYQ